MYKIFYEGKNNQRSIYKQSEMYNKKFFKRVYPGRMPVKDEMTNGIHILIFFQTFKFHH